MGGAKVLDLLKLHFAEAQSITSTVSRTCSVQVCRGGTWCLVCREGGVVFSVQGKGCGV